MPMSKVHRESHIYFIVGLLFACDQVVKWLALQLSSDGFDLIPSFLRFELHLNPGVLFVIPLPNLLVILTSLAVLVLILVLLIRSDRADNESAVWHYALIFGGGVSNLIDRFRLGASIDYVTLDGPIIPYFNLGDIMIAVGAILLLDSIVRSRPSAERLTKE